MNNKDYIWYVCYGSNLYLKRFMCYLTGEGLPEYGISEEPSWRFNDTTPPIKDKGIEIPYELYFAGKSRRWDNMAVAYLDKDKPGKTYGRAYLITKEQYEHVKHLEGPKYQYEIDLGIIDGTPVKTFTNDHRMEDSIPSGKYTDVIMKGLMEIGISRIEAIKYIKAHIK